MAHAQQQILDALQAVLAGGSTVAGIRVYVDQVDPLQSSQLPAILIAEEPEGEVSEPSTLDGIEQRELNVAVACVLSHTTTAAADAREFGLAVEKLIAGSSSLAELASGGHRITTSRHANNGEGDRLLAARQQSWRFTYTVAPAAPDVLV